MGILNAIALARPHLLISLLLFLLIGSMVFQNDVTARGMTLVPILIVFQIFYFAVMLENKVLYGAMRRMNEKPEEAGMETKTKQEKIESKKEVSREGVKYLLERNGRNASA